MYGGGNYWSGLVGVIFVLVAIGLILGLVLTGSELVNPFEGLSQYEQNRVENRRLAQQSEIDLQQYAILKEAETQAQLQRIAAEIDHLQLTYQQERDLARQAREQELRIAQEREALKLQLLRVAGFTAIAVAGLCLLTLSAGAAVRLARVRPAPARRAEVWTPERRRQAIAAARQREREERAWARQREEEEARMRFSELLRTVAHSERPGFEDLLSLPT